MSESARNNASQPQGDDAANSTQTPMDDPVVCFCNEIPLSKIVRALEDGARDLTDIIDATWAGCGPCGGTCQPDLEAIVEDWYAEDRDES